MSGLGAFGRSPLGAFIRSPLGVRANINPHQCEKLTLSGIVGGVIAANDSETIVWTDSDPADGTDHFQQDPDNEDRLLCIANPPGFGGNQFVCAYAVIGWSLNGTALFGGGGINFSIGGVITGGGAGGGGGVSSMFPIGSVTGKSGTAYLMLPDLTMFEGDYLTVNVGNVNMDVGTTLTISDPKLVVLVC